MSLNHSFWVNRRVLITGHTGFKGSWLSLYLKYLGAEVCGIALEPATSQSMFNHANLREGINHNIIDIRDSDAVTKAISNFSPEVIFHLAAQPLVRASYIDPISTYSTNVMGTVNVLEAAKNIRSVKVIINVTTDKCYLNREWHWGYREEDHLGGDDPYSSSKACSELVTLAYRKSFYDNNQVGIATARAGNVIGGGDWSEDRLVPDLIRSIYNKEPIYVRNPQSIRPWQHVLEPLRGYLLLAQNLSNEPLSMSGPWNFGPKDDDCMSVSDLIQRMEKLGDLNIDVRSEATSQVHEANLLKLDSAKARECLTWTQSWNIDDALLATLDWYKSSMAGLEMQEFTLSQIEKFNQVKDGKVIN